MLSRLTVQLAETEEKIRLFNLEYKQMHGRKQNQKSKQIVGKQIFLVKESMFLN